MCEGLMDAQNVTEKAHQNGGPFSWAIGIAEKLAFPLFNGVSCLSGWGFHAGLGRCI